MDFGYKVIRNRLGSLVANAIQKKIKESGTNILIVKCTPIEGDWDDPHYSTNYTSTEVKNAYNNGTIIIYRIDTIQCSTINVLSSYVQCYTSNREDIRHIDSTVIIQNLG